MQIQLFGQFMHEGIVSLMLAVVGGILMYPIRKVQKAYKELMEAVNSTRAELVTQRENCLSTLQNQGEKQVELLGKAVSTLDAIHLGQVEMSGFLKAQNERRS